MMKKEDVPKSRRRFLKTAGYTAAGLAAIPAMFRQASTMSTIDYDLTKGER
jgi:hypothetical protein